MKYEQYENTIKYLIKRFELENIDLKAENEKILAKVSKLSRRQRDAVQYAVGIQEFLDENMDSGKVLSEDS